MIKGYIQWYLDANEMKEATEPFLRYKKARNEALNQASFNMYGKMIKERFNNNKQTAQYLRLARELVNNENFIEAFNKVTDNLQFPSMTNQQMFVGKIQEAMVKNSNMYQAFTKEIQSSMQSIINVLGQTGLGAIVPDSPAYDALVKLYNGDSESVNRIITEDKHLKLEKTFAGQYSAMISKLPDFIDILNAPGDDVQATFKLLARMLMPIQTLVGVCSEYQAKYEVNKLIDKLAKDLKSSGMTITRTGDEGDSGFRIGTADLTIQMGKNPNISFTMPNLGMSLKRSHKNLDTAKDVNIKLKSSTYGGLMQEIDPALVTAFYTIYANTRPIIRDQQQAALPTGALTSAYAQMKARMLVTALVGGSKSDNLVFVMVINNKPFTIFDLLKKMKEETYANESTVLLKPAFRTARGGVKLKESKNGKYSKHQLQMAEGVLGMHQKFYDKYTYEEREKRSEDIRNFIDSISAAMEIKITQKLLNAI